MFKFAACALLFTTLSAAAPPAKGMQGLDPSHADLIQAVQDIGVEVVIGTEHPVCDFAFGAYSSMHRKMLLCKDAETPFTSRQLNTLRHESIHVAQDCRGGRWGDLAFQEGQSMASSFKQATIARLDLGQKLVPYVRMGVDESVLVIEAEAISMSHIWSGQETLEHLEEACTASA